MSEAYHFREMTVEDESLVRCWLSRRHVADWWKDSSDFAYVSGSLSHPDLAQFIVLSEGRPFAYLQCYRMSVWDAGYGAQPPETRGIDQFIGEADWLGAGHGSALIRQFCDRLLTMGVPKILVDPEPGNKRAIRAYEKAGFLRIREIQTPDGIALMMERTP